ncbi:hypothetical protein Bbelb_140530 [Branchiostoma belcheri]|nr:hypothetical protein Bbelb_140530 [Branchiostoma belcheri]
MSTQRDWIGTCHTGTIRSLGTIRDFFERCVAKIRMVPRLYHTGINDRFQPQLASFDQPSGQTERLDRTRESSDESNMPRRDDYATEGVLPQREGFPLQQKPSLSVAKLPRRQNSLRGRLLSSLTEKNNADPNKRQCASYEINGHDRKARGCPFEVLANTEYCGNGRLLLTQVVWCGVSGLIITA